MYTYMTVNGKIEKMCKTLELVFVKISVAIPFIPTIMMSTVNYYVFDLGNESFFLPCPILYVFYYTFSTLETPEAYPNRTADIC